MKDNRKYVSYDTRFRHLGLDVLNMILLTEIENLCKLPKGCYASDKQLSELLTINEKNTRERLYFMRDLGYIGIQTKFENKKRKRTITFLLNEVKTPQGGLTLKRMRKKKIVNTPQGVLTDKPQGVITQKLVDVIQLPDNEIDDTINTIKVNTPQGVNNIEEVKKVKKVKENRARTGASTGTQILGENSPVDTPTILALFCLVDENNNKNIKTKMEEPKMEQMKLTPTEEPSTGNLELSNTLHDARAEFDNFDKTTSTEEPKTNILTIEDQMKKKYEETPTKENFNQGEMMEPNEILKKIQSREQQIKDVLDEIINLDMFSNETREELRKLDNSNCIEYILDFDYSEYETRILRPKFERISLLMIELNKLKYEYAHSGENRKIRVSEEDRTKFKNSKTFSRYLNDNSNDETFIMYLNEHPNYEDVPESDNLFDEWMLDKFIKERKNKIQ